MSQPSPQAPTAPQPPTPPQASQLQPGSLLIFCDGGLANRINSLLGGLVLAERLGRSAQVLWPRNNRCGAGFGAVFKHAPDVPVHEWRLQDLVPLQQQLQLWLHENDVGFTQPVLPLRQLDAVSAQASLDAADARPILYAENTVLSWLPDADVQRAALRLGFADDIVAHARALLAKHAAAGYIGIHLRATDFSAPPPTDAMLAAVKKNPDKRFFVCSDDASLEARFAELPNVFVHAKTARVQKLQDGPWRSAVQDSDGLPYGSNIDRNADSVRQAAVDLLLLAASTPVRTSGSSFLALAERLRGSGWVARHMADALPAAAPAHTSQQEVLALLALMRPQQMVSDHKVRIGGDADGGYVMPSLALKSTAVLSIGIGDQVSFDAELAERGAHVYQYDHTIPGQPMAHENFHFHSLGWGPRDEGPLRSLHSMVAAMDWDDAQHAILKFDTEGAEWDALAATSSADLARFDVIAGEFHYFHNLAVRSFYDQVKAVLEKINRSHVAVHLHANNATGIRLVQGVPVPPLLEVTFVKRDVVATAGPCTDPIPGPLDRPNMADRPDLCLRPF